jgi:hypothetical protein
MSYSNHLYQPVSLFPCSQPVASSSSLLTPNIPILFSAIPQHVTNSLIAVDIQHFSKPCTVTSGEMHSHSIMIHIDSYLMVCKLFEPMKIHNFLCRWCLCCQEFKNRFWISVLCLWPDQFEFMALFMVFNMWIV